MQKLFVLVMGLLSAFYLFNPSAGLFELIPDNFPFIGNLDEATAATMLLACLRYYGLDLTGWFRRKKTANILETPPQSDSQINSES